MPTQKKIRNLVQAEDFARLKHPRSIAPSPDGESLAYTLAWCDLTKKKYYANLDVLNTKTGESSQWTRGEHTDRSPIWSMDGRRLAFLRTEKGQESVYVITPGGGEAECVFKTLGSLAEVKWALNDQVLICRFRKADPDPEAEKAIAEGKEPKSEVPAVRRITRLYYRLDGDGFLPNERWHLYRLDLKSKRFSALTHGKADVEAFAVSSDGETAAYVTNVERDPDMHPFHQRIALLNLRTGRKRLLDLGLGEKFALAFSPNGRYLAYIGHHNTHDAWGVEPVHPYLVDLKSGREKNLTPEIDRQAQDLTIGDLGYGLASPQLFFSSDSRHLFYPISDEGDTYVVRCPLKHGTPERIWKSSGQVAIFSASGNAAAAIHLDFRSFGDLHVCHDIKAKRPVFHKLTNFNNDYRREKELGKVREIRFRSEDGTRLHGWIMTPPRFNPRRKYPAILEVHGGPRTQYGRVYFHEMQYLAALGFVVMFTNPRGSQGYGKEFAGAITAAWGTHDYDDIMAAADELEQLPYVDKKRIGITGGSYGGYMTNWAMGHTRRFRAGVTQRSVVDLKTFTGSSDIGFHDHLEFGGFWWDQEAAYAEMSPLTHADGIRDPLLIIHSEMDLRCPVEQAEQLFARLKILGRTVELLRFPEESHGLSRGGRPDRRVIRLKAIGDWFKKYMA